MTTAVLARLHAQGRRGLVYTVNDAAEAARLLALGVDGLISDAVDALGPGSAAAA
jgi:glycerophosphoryl diester phosphodiesterase